MTAAEMLEAAARARWEAMEPPITWRQLLRYRQEEEIRLQRAALLALLPLLEQPDRETVEELCEAFDGGDIDRRNERLGVWVQGHSVWLAVLRRRVEREG